MTLSLEFIIYRNTCISNKCKTYIINSLTYFHFLWLLSHLKAWISHKPTDLDIVFYQSQLLQTLHSTLLNLQFWLQWRLATHVASPQMYGARPQISDVGGQVDQSSLMDAPNITVESLGAFYSLGWWIVFHNPLYIDENLFATKACWETDGYRLFNFRTRRRRNVWLNLQLYNQLFTIYR